MTELSSFIKNERLAVLVKPNAKKTEIIGFDEAKNAVRIAIAAPPADNEANLELIRFVSRTLKKRVLIERGLTSKEKLLRVDDR